MVSVGPYIMEGYPYIQKVSSPYAAFQDSTSNPDKAAQTNGSFEQPVYEQLMPSSLVAVNPYCYDAGIPSTCNNVQANSSLPAVTPCSGTYNIDPFTTPARSDNCTLQSLIPEQSPQYVPPVPNRPQTGDTSNENVKHSFPGAVASLCNTATEDPKSTPVEICLRIQSEQAPECVLNRNDQITVPSNEEPTTPLKEVDINEPSEKEPNTCSQQDASAILEDTSAKEDEHHRITTNSEPDSTTDVQASQTLDTEVVAEKPVESNPEDEDVNSSDSIKSDSDTDTPHSGNVSSLFKNVVLVQADTLMVEENDSLERSESDVQALLDETETVDPIVTSSVEDIGREDEPMENELLDPSGLLIDETGDDHNFEIMEGVAVGKMGQIVALDAPIIDPNDVTEEPENEQNDKKVLNEENNTNGTHIRVKKSKPIDTVSLSSDDDTSEGRTSEMTSQKCQMRKRGVIRVVNVEKELLNSKKKRSKVSNDDPFGSCVSSSSDDVPNDMYFGSPDRVFTVSTKLHWQRQKQKRNTNYARRKTTDRYEEASSDNDDEEHAQRRAKKAEEIARLKLPAYQQQQLQQLVLKKHPKRDRFYDRSQDIPNDIYFGNVAVPLHILHASSSSSSDEEPWPVESVKSATSSNHRKECTTYTKSSNYRYSSSSSRAESTSTQGSVRSVVRMKEYLKMAGFRHMRYQKLWQGCETNHERAEAILRFLHAQGLQGEPTDEKCRELRKQIQLQKEVEVLDTSLIIGSGEGRVTRQRTKKVSETTAAEPSVHPLPDACIKKDEQTPESVVSTETTVLATECAQQQEEDGNIASETGLEHSLPAAKQNGMLG
uniref:Uncharacterized protein n=1 Tax=Anopheles culicifacies TaxID=139723 RepID=A0A182M9F4_9DIPT